MRYVNPLADALLAQASDGVVTETEIPGLSLVRIQRPTALAPCIYEPCLIVVAQGRKRAHLGDGWVVYDADHTLLCTLTLPIESQVLEASSERPFLAGILTIDPALVSQLLVEMEPFIAWPQDAPTQGALQTTPTTVGLARAFARLVRAAGDPMDRRVLGPALVRQILYEVLRGPHGGVLRDFVLRDSSAHRVARVVRFVSERYREPLTIEAITRHAGMSPSALHHHFKAATSLSPLQFIKRLRLHRARSLLLTGASAGDAAYAVGYGSPSQFSREFRRLFGVTPSSLRSAS